MVWTKEQIIESAKQHKAFFPETMCEILEYEEYTDDGVVLPILNIQTGQVMEYKVFTSLDSAMSHFKWIFPCHFRSNIHIENI